MPLLNSYQTVEVPTKLHNTVNRAVIIQNETDKPLTLEANDSQDALQPKLTIKLLANADFKDPRKESELYQGSIRLCEVLNSCLHFY